MRAIKAVLVLCVLLCAAQVYADVIHVGLGAGSRVNFRRPGGTGQRVTFTGLTILTSDSANGTALTINPGTAGYFLFTSVSGGQGIFATPTGANFTMGSTASGILTGSISSIAITGATTGAVNTTFTMQLTFSNMHFQACSTVGCVSSATLRRMTEGSTATMSVSFTLANNVASSLAALLAMTGNHNNLGLTGGMDETIAPEPASLALFGTGLLVVGIRLTRHRKRPE